VKLWDKSAAAAVYEFESVFLGVADELSTKVEFSALNVDCVALASNSVKGFKDNNF